MLSFLVPMPAQDIIEKLKDSGLTGRGGAGFPVWKKWQAVVDAESSQKYVIANGAEGEPGVFKDDYVLDKKAKELITGIKIAMETINASEAYIYLNQEFFKKYQKPLLKLIGKDKIHLFEKPEGYIAGEETTLLNAIEGKRLIPRLRPPYPTTCGLYGSPTLINNLETFYQVALIAEDKYFGERLYSIGGDAPKPGVFELSEKIIIKEILEKSKNLPAFDFFVQIGGGASGEVLNSTQLEKPLSGTGSIIIYNLKKTDLKKLLNYWIEFFAKESCGQCVPCREGTYRLRELFQQNKQDWSKIGDLLFVLEQTSFCALGGSVPTPILSFYKNIKEASDI